MNPRAFFWPSLSLAALSVRWPILLAVSAGGLLLWLIMLERASRTGALDRNDW